MFQQLCVLIKNNTILIHNGCDFFVLQVSDKRGFEEAAKRLKLETEDRDKVLPSLRVQSRRKYLEKRKEDKVAELEADILDDEYLFEDNV